MRAVDVFTDSDPALTKRYYAELGDRGPAGRVAVNLFRAQKCSSRAKKYRGGIRGRGSYRGMAYERKQWAMEQLCQVLLEHGKALGIRFGWKEDPHVLFGQDASWVLYVDLPQGQVSFHSPARGVGPDYAGEWDQVKASQERILAFCDAVSAGAVLIPLTVLRTAAPAEGDDRQGDLFR